MNAPTAGQEAGTRKTENTGTAPPAGSVTRESIAGFIERHSKAAASEGFSGIRSTADAAARLGFVSCANVRAAGFLEDLQATHHMAEEYAECYPASLFLPWRTFHRVIGSLRLWCDLPSSYTGVIPAEQIPWMEVFERDIRHWPSVEDFVAMTQLDPESRASFLVTEAWWFEVDVPGARAVRATDWFRPDLNSRHKVEELLTAPMNKIGDVQKRLLRFVGEFATSFFVVAPEESFNTSEDWISRARNLAESSEVERIPVPDPLVVQPVKGGVIVIAAWGDEGDEIRRMAEEVKA